jgi:hypothetical protein
LPTTAKLACPTCEQAQGKQITAARGHPRSASPAKSDCQLSILLLNLNGGV